MGARAYRGRLIWAGARRLPLPDGRRVRLDVVHHPGAVAVVPMITPREVLLVRQYRPVAGCWLVEIVAGTREPREPPRRTAARELEEEAGHRAGRLVRLGSFFTAPGFSTERIHLYLATRLRPVPRHPDRDEVLSLVRMPLRRAVELAIAGKIHDAKTIAALLTAWHQLGRA